MVLTGVAAQRLPMTCMNLLIVIVGVVSGEEVTVPTPTRHPVTVEVRNVVYYVYVIIDCLRGTAIVVGVRINKKSGLRCLQHMLLILIVWSCAYSAARGP